MTGALVAVLIAVAAERCDDATTQAALNRCYAEQAEAADDAMHKALARHAERLDVPGRELLGESQTRWRSWRDAECRFRTVSLAGGSARGFAYSVCLAHLTRQRNDELRALANCEEGDLACAAIGGERGEGHDAR